MMESWFSLVWSWLIERKHYFHESAHKIICVVNEPKLPVCNQTLTVVSSLCAYWSLETHSASKSTVFMRKTCKTTVASHTRALSCVCTLTELIFDKRGHVHKLTIRSFTVHLWELPSRFSTTSQPPRPSFAMKWELMQLLDLDQPAGPPINASFKDQWSRAVAQTTFI